MSKSYKVSKKTMNMGPKKGKTVYTGRAPKGLLDLKAAVRYLRFFDKDMGCRTYYH